MKATADRLHAVVAETIETAHIGSGVSLCCALSGGVDSVVLLHLLYDLQPRFGYALEAMTVHHGLSPNADGWIDFCRTLCERLSTPLQIARVRVERDHPSGLEAAARIVRLQALDATGADWLAFGHHFDDQAETLLFRLFRGTGVHGATGMPRFELPQPPRPGRVRPLLNVRRSEIVAFAHQHRLTWVEDESNADRSFARNRLRHDIIPPIEMHFPAAVTSLGRAVEHFRDASALLDELAVIDAESCTNRADGTLSRQRLVQLSDARLSNLLRYQVRIFQALPPSQRHLREILRQLRESQANALHLPCGNSACCVYRDAVWLEPFIPDIPTCRLWQGEPVLSWIAGKVSFHPEKGKGLALTRLGGKRVELRMPWPGLQFKPGAKRATRGFRALCQEAGIPPWQRRYLPVLCVEGEAAWLPGIGVAAAYSTEEGEAGITPHWDYAFFRPRGKT